MELVEGRRGATGSDEVRQFPMYCLSAPNPPFVALIMELGTVAISPLPLGTC